VFGKELIKELNKLGIIVDVSHLNEAGFDDLLKISDTPFAATHSNCFSIREHPRNLKDEQIKEIIARKGFIGMNFYSEFLGDKDDDNTVLINKFLKHVEHVLELGGEDVLGLGADYDGINRTPFPDVMSYRDIEGLLINDLKLSEAQTNKILHSNLVDFTQKMLK
ncbi:MAG: membrane dipeptidase, partial [Chlorobi bacterium]|nr:membrane dipeptidase [Chlorobiota bacterium]